MKQKLARFGLITASLILMSPTLFGAEEEMPKRTLKTNYQEVYNQTPGAVDSFTKMFSEGIFYGRLRSNTFYYRWEEETGKQKDQIISGLGGSLIYKSATLADFDFTGGLYYSRAFYSIDEDDVGALKSGKDVFSR
ncbi:MAG: hypothetical protein WBG65_05830, partial [Sulfurimonadaceae bacterium]